MSASAHGGGSCFAAASSCHSTRSVARTSRSSSSPGALSDTRSAARARTETGRRRQTRSASSFPRCRAGRRRMPWSRRRNVTRRMRRRKVRWAEAERLKSAVDAALRVVRRPARDVLKQPDRANAPIAAEVEPVMRAARHANQIAGFNFDGEHRPAVGRMNMKKPAALDNQADFVFVVPVLGAEFGEHRVEPRRRRVDVDDVRGHIAAARLQAGDLVVRTRRGSRRRSRLAAPGRARRPALEIDSASGEICARSPARR